MEVVSEPTDDDNEPFTDLLGGLGKQVEGLQAQAAPVVGSEKPDELVAEATEPGKTEESAFKN